MASKVPPYYGWTRPLDNAAGCPPNVGLPIEGLEGSPLVDPGAFATLTKIPPPGSQWFMWGGYYKQGVTNPPFYHAYVTDIVVPTGYVACIIQAGFDDLADAMYDLYLNGLPHPILSGVADSTWTYDEVNPPGAATYTGRAYALATQTDGAISGLRACIVFQPNPLVIDEGTSVRARIAVDLANKTGYLAIIGYYAKKLQGVEP